MPAPAPSTRTFRPSSGKPSPIRRTPSPCRTTGISNSSAGMHLRLRLYPRGFCYPHPSEFPMTVHRHRQRQAFQLIELIVVIVILVVLLGVFFPATHQVRIGPVRQTTINNLRQLVIAAHNAHDTYKKFPPYFGFYPGTRAGTSSVQSAERSIFVHILPFIEGSTIYN